MSDKKNSKNKAIKNDLIQLVTLLLYTPLAIRILTSAISDTPTAPADTGNDINTIINDSLSSASSLIIKVAIEMVLSYIAVNLGVILAQKIFSKLLKKD